MSRLQRAFHEHLGAQCGFCTPGMIMAAEALLRSNPHPDREQIRAALAGNLCRCTGYVKIIESVEAACAPGSKRMNAPERKVAHAPPASEPRGVGARLPLVDGVEKVTGTARYTADLPAGGALVGKILRSPYAHAELLEVDISEAAGLPGVRA
jgi:hypothetical protein